MDNCPWTTIVHGQRLFTDNCQPTDGSVVSWTIVREIKCFLKFSWPILKFDGQLRNFRKFLTIYKFSKFDDGQCYPRNDNPVNGWTIAQQMLHRLSAQGGSKQTKTNLP